MSSPEQLEGDAEQGVIETWMAETPFLESNGESRDPIPPASEAFGPRDHQEIASPFASSWGTGASRVLGPKSAMFAQFMAEVRDQEFEAAYEDVVHEASALVAERFSYEAGDPVQLEADATAELRDYLEPLQRESEAMLDRAGAAAGERDAGVLTEAEVEALIDSGVRSGTMVSPAFENFLKKLAKKAKKVAKAVKKVAKKIGKAIPLKGILEKLKKLVRPLIRKVLTKALRRLPAPVRPIAAQLARKMLGIDLTPPAPPPEPVFDAGADDAAAPEEPLAAADDPAADVEDADVQLAGAAIEGDQFEREVELAELAAGQEPQGPSPLLRLDRARADFARRVVSLKSSEEAEPAFEAFLPAVMAAAKLGVKLMGRPKVVKLLAGLMARMMKPFIGPQNAAALAAPLTSAGMSMIGLEAPEAGPVQAGYALASTVEGTVARLASAPPAVLRSELLLEAYAASALAEAAAAALPDEVMKASARETSALPGAWVSKPDAGAAKRYRKYSRVIDVTITPQNAATLKTFGGISLATMLRDCAGVKVDRPISAKLHLYEAVPGTTLSLITKLEKGVQGLGTPDRQAWSQVFPLTPFAAGVLTGEVGLGRTEEARFLQNPNLIAVGQRLGFLEQPRPVPKPESKEASHTRIWIDLVTGRLVLAFYYSEADSSAIVQSRGKAKGTIINLLAAGRDVEIDALFAGAATPNLHLIHEANPIQGQIPDQVWTALQAAGRKLKPRLVGWMLKAFELALAAEEGYRQFFDQFARAAESPEEGVTATITIHLPSLKEAMNALLSDQPGASGLEALGRLLLERAQPSLAIAAGKVRYA